MTWGPIINTDFNTCSIGQSLAAGLGSRRHARPGPKQRLRLEPTWGLAGPRQGCATAMSLLPCGVAFGGGTETDKQGARESGRFY